jgi:FMN phosphatase YigB (HAD superfamily)
MKDKFVFFDVGGVIVNDFNHNNGWEVFINSLGIEDHEKFRIWWKKNCGRVSIGQNLEDTVDELKKEFNMDLPNNFSFTKHFVGAISENRHIWPALNLIKSKSEVGLLANMYYGVLDQIFKSNLIPETDWRLIVDSSIVKIEKPSDGIYELAQNKSLHTGKDILFIDNTAENLEPAKKLGWDTFLYDPKNHEKSCEGLLIKFNEFMNK